MRTVPSIVVGLALVLAGCSGSVVCEAPQLQFAVALDTYSERVAAGPDGRTWVIGDQMGQPVVRGYSVEGVLEVERPVGSTVRRFFVDGAGALHVAGIFDGDQGQGPTLPSADGHTVTLEPASPRCSGSVDSEAYYARWDADGVLEAAWVAGGGGDSGPWSLEPTDEGGALLLVAYEDDLTVDIAGIGRADYPRECPDQDESGLLAVEIDPAGAAVSGRAWQPTGWGGSAAGLNRGAIALAGTLLDRLVLDKDEVLYSDDPDLDGFLAAFGPRGRVEWSRLLESSVFAQPLAVARGPEDGVYLLARYSEDVVFAAGEPDEVGFVSDSPDGWDTAAARFDRDGHLLNASSLPGSAHVVGLHPMPDASTLVAGSTLDERGFFWGSAPLDWRGGRDAMALSLDPEGEPGWLVSAGGPGDDLTWAFDVVADGSALVLYGSFGDAGDHWTEATFGEGDAAVTLQASEEAHMFLARYSLCE